MSCIQTLNGIPANCTPSQGGITEVYIANFGDCSYISTGGTEKIAYITMETGKKFKPYYFKKNTGNMTSTLNVSAENGTNFVQTDLGLSFNKLQTSSRIEISALSLGELRVIVKDANNSYWFLGETEFVAATAGTGETGTARADKNGFSLTLTDYNATYPKELNIGPGGSAAGEIDLSAIVDF